jgi:hypothetical protein
MFAIIQAAEGFFVKPSIASHSAELSRIGEEKLSRGFARTLGT